MISIVWAYLVRGFRIERSYKLTFFGRYVGQLVYLLFIYYLSRLVESGASTLLAGYRAQYFGFLLVGGLFSQYLTTAMRQMPIQVRDEMMLGSMEPALVAPVPTALALLGPGVWSQVEATLLLLFGLGVGRWVFGADLSRANWPSAFVIAMLSLVCLSAMGVLSVAFVVVFKRTDPINWLIGTTIQFFSGVYFPISVLPVWLRVGSYLFPLTYSLTMLRAAILQGAPLGAMGGSLWILTALATVLCPLSFIVLNRAIGLARQRGTLAHY